MRKGSPMATRAPNLVVIMADQHRADLMGCAGAPGVLTPNLDRLASEGVRFSRVNCQGPLCMPARASFMTERYVRDHGVYTNWAEIAPESPTYVKALRDAGYHTTLLGKAHLYKDDDTPDAAPHRRSRAAAAGARVRRGDRDRRQVRRADAEPLHRRACSNAGCSTRTAGTSRTAATRARTRPGSGATKRVPMWDSTPMPLPLDAYIDAWHGELARSVDRGLRRATSRSSCSSASRVRTIRGTRRRPRSTATPTSTSTMPATTRRPDSRRHRPIRPVAPGVSRPLRHDDDDRRRDSRHAPRVLRRRQRHRRRGRSHRRRARRPRAARRHVDRLHERSRRDGRQPRDDVEVRAVRAGGTCPAHHPAAGRQRGRASSTSSSSTSTCPRRCATIAQAPEIRASEGRSLRLSSTATTPAPRLVSISENWGFAVVRDRALQARRRRGRVRRRASCSTSPSIPTRTTTGSPTRSVVRSSTSSMESFVRPFLATAPVRPHRNPFAR